MTKSRTVSLALAIALAVGGAGFSTGCRRDGAERAGEKLDRLGDKIEDAVDPKGPAEKAGEKIDRAIDDAKD